jgi:hypothetical protein
MEYYNGLYLSKETTPVSAQECSPPMETALSINPKQL